MPKISNVYPMANGTFRANVSLGFDKITGKRIRIFKNGFATQKEAVLWQKRMLADFSETSISANSTMYFKTFMKEFFVPDYKNKVRERTFEATQGRLKRLSYFGNMQLLKITPPLVKRWQNELFEQGLSKNYVRHLHQLLQQVFDLAIKLNMLVKNPAKIVGNVKKEKAKVDFWTLEEFQKFINSFDKNNVYEFLYLVTFLCFFMTGIRTSELQALNWKDIDFINHTLLINKSMYYKNKKEWKITEPKSSSSVRLIAIDDDTIRILQEWKHVQEQFGDFEFVFSLSETPVTKSTLMRVLRSHAKFLGLKPIRIHDLRHSHASFMLALGMNDLEMKTRLGHADIQTTLGTYSHLRPNAMRDVATRMTGKIKIDTTTKKYQSNFHSNQYRSNHSSFN